MSIMRYDPFRDLERWLEQQSPASWNASSIPMDVSRNEDAFKLDFDLPGVDPSSIDLMVEGNVLTVTAERPETPASSEEMVISERRHGMFRREVVLDETVDLDNVEASYDNGVLHVTIPISKAKKARKIEIGKGDEDVINVSGKG